MSDGLFEDYIYKIKTAIDGISRTSVTQALGVLSATFNSNGKICIAGNGGSAATASHFATDLSRCTNVNGEPVRSISLCDNAGLLTAISNDFGFEYIFTRQLNNIAAKGDLLVVISASGTSKNILRAIEFAKSHKISTLALTGFDGGQARFLADFSLHVPTINGDYGVVEDVHLMLCHYLSSRFIAAKQFSI
jgi:D-sedoheptulose 7-phosphate isomerase